MTDFLFQWLNILIRWAHIIVGIGWIGASFYFVALDFRLRRRDGQDEALFGEAWQVHGGGFYHVQKYRSAPQRLPEKLIWYKWDAYLTWLTGFALLVSQYYLQADIYLVDASKADLSALEASAFSIASLIVGWIVYDLLCRTLAHRSSGAAALAVFALIVGAAWGYSEIYSGRGALIQVGALIGTLMAANVFIVIIPNQREIVADLIAGRTPDPELGKAGKQRSLHNNYLTLPVLLTMVSNHYPALTGSKALWAIVALIVIAGASARHLINRHEAGDDLKSFIWAAPAGAAALVAAVIATTPPHLRREKAAPQQVSDAAAFAVVERHCASCHAPVAGAEDFFIAPKEVRLGSIDDMRRFRDQIAAQAVAAEAMPPNNATAMSAEERILLGQWIGSQGRQGR